MNKTRIFGMCVVRDEEDVIAQTLTHARQYCERIFVLDNGSTDRTWRIVQDLAQVDDAITPLQQILEPFANGLRARIYNAVHHELSKNDWWLILDADEFLAEDPRPLIQLAVDAHADRVNAWIIQFFFTERDAEEWRQGKDSPNRSILDRRRHYKINWQDCRLFRNCPNREWAVVNTLPDWLGPIYGRRLLIRHYQYRDPEQIEKRLRLRYGHYQFPHVRSTNWQSMIRDSRKLDFYKPGEPWRFRLSGVLYYYRYYWYERMRSAVRGGAVRRLRRLMHGTSRDAYVR